jgi:hypothetical protein
MPNRSERPKRGARPGRRSPATVEQALAESLQHARQAIAEGLLAARSLLDAASIAINGKPAILEAGETRGATDLRLVIATLARGLDELIDAARSSDADLPQPVVDAILGALDTEILRWEQRSRTDPDARAVLRAFLGLREILWELGLRGRDGEDQQESRRKDPAEDRPADASSARRAAAPSDPTDFAQPEEARPRVQRVQIRD